MRELPALTRMTKLTQKAVYAILSEKGVRPHTLAAFRSAAERDTTQTSDRSATAGLIRLGGWLALRLGLEVPVAFG